MTKSQALLDFEKKNKEYEESLSRLEQSRSFMIDRKDAELEEEQINKLNEELDLRIEEMFGLKMGTFDNS